ncbi:hypothetical protein BOTBODRAFT_56833 [Botryobasidium botryosum FD-172 SS1]|uniref:mRNA-capping enzyme subunit alpha n=1 Tax=Botryobasidium botryosum (strain FD-172 SS1) TaxID=930990 RepID=A0A067MC42_BOTB1|nr:hypothetical protein BOTBODRAFT_56833 [Botryobasidium botryosum FD-172 SS1]
MPVSRTPDLPGLLVPPEQAARLKALVAQICGLDHHRFIGSQPVSFTRMDLRKLEEMDYWVCEKSDGVRVLIFIVGIPPSEQEVYLIDRKNEYRALQGLFFPHYENPQRPLGHTLLDGELVTDIDPRTGKETTRLLLFDCIVVDNQNLMSKPLNKRYGRLQEWVCKPQLRMVAQFPNAAALRPFDIRLKTMERAYAIEKVLKEDLPKLQHGNDGLIYTCAETPYVVGTDERILKWKPPSENSIDFKLELRFPPSRERLQEPDFFAKPAFLLNVWHGDSQGPGGHREALYKYFDYMHIDDMEWEQMKESGEQYDDRIVEAAWDKAKQNWHFLRFRNDKNNGNHETVVEKILQSIQDGVEVDVLIAQSGAIREAWKARESRIAAGPPPHTQRPPPHQGHPPRPSHPPLPPNTHPSNPAHPPHPSQPLRPTHQTHPGQPAHPANAPQPTTFKPPPSGPGFSKVSGPTVFGGMNR